MLVLAVAGSLCLLLAVFVASLPSFAGPLWTPTRILIALLLPTAIAVRSRKRGTLSASGAVTAIFVGFVITSCSYVHVITLLAFYVPSTVFTKWGKSKKRNLAVDEHGVYEETSGRNWRQVLANGGIATLACLCAVIQAGALGFLGSLACAAGDTWASELGMLVSSQPVLVTTFKRVPPGTNGAVSFAGLIFSALGGAVVGSAHYLGLLIFARHVVIAQAVCQWNLVFVGALAGFFGSVFDSILGALFQYSGFDVEKERVVPAGSQDAPYAVHISGINLLSNDGVNLLAAIVTGLLTYRIAEGVWTYSGCID